MLAVFDFTYGPLNPGLAYIVCCAGVFLAMRCTARALDRKAAARAQWLLLGGVTLGTVGFWAMHMIGLLGFTIRSETVYYNVPITLLSLLVAVVTATVGLVIVGFRPKGYGSLLAGGLITGAGVVIMQYLGFAALRTQAKLSYQPDLVIVSGVIAVLAAIAVLAVAVRLRETGPTTVAALIAGVVLVAMYYTGMMAIRAQRPAHPTAMFMGGAHSTTAQSFILPLILGIGTICFLVSAAIALWPTADEIRYDAALLDHIGKRNQRSATTPLSATAVVVRPPGSGTAAGRGRGAHANSWTPPANTPPPPANTPPPRAPAHRGPSTGPSPQRIPGSTPPPQRTASTGPRTQWTDSSPAAEEEPAAWTFAEVELRRPPEPR